MERIEFISRSPSDTLAIGECIGRSTGAGDLFLLYGELGAGKTQLVKGLAKGLAVTDWEYVVSPSFTLMNTYEGRLTLCHVDLYRVESTDAAQLGIEEYLDQGVAAVEWAEKSSWWGRPRMARCGHGMPRSTSCRPAAWRGNTIAPSSGSPEV